MKKLTILALALALLAALAAPAAFADNDANGLAGTYLTTILDGDGNVASRSLITFNADRTMSVVDSNQIGGVVQFSDQQGAWKVTPGRGIVARTIDITFTPDPGLARNDYVATFSPGRETVSGTIDLRIYPFDGDPINDPGLLILSFTFTGERVRAD